MEPVGLVSALPRFQHLQLAGWDSLVLGGHEIRQTTALAEARQLFEQSQVFSAKLVAAAESDLEQLDRRVRPGTLVNVGPRIESLAAGAALEYRQETPAQAVERLKSDIEQFRKAEQLQRVLVVNVSSTEPAATGEFRDWNWSQTQAALKTEAGRQLPASTLYAIAAMQAGCDYINFTPSVGSDLPALNELALQQKVCHVGRDGKTGETLMKAVLAPMFAARNLKVMSWVGHNIFGNLDGKVLDDPQNKANKVRSKDHLLTEILGYKPTTLVSIEYIEDMADWKTAWDHIHFQGFMGTPMVLQFTWQGCDSLLAAPLVLDLVRFTEREARRGGVGVMQHLASFFKSPMGESVPPEFGKQFQSLELWAEAIS